MSPYARGSSGPLRRLVLTCAASVEAVEPRAATATSVLRIRTGRNMVTDTRMLSGRGNTAVIVSWPYVLAHRSFQRRALTCPRPDVLVHDTKGARLVFG